MNFRFLNSKNSHFSKSLINNSFLILNSNLHLSTTHQIRKPSRNFFQIKYPKGLQKISLSSYSTTTTSKSFVKEIIKNQTSLSIKWSDSNSLSNFNYIWLRDNCQCPLCIHPDSRQKLLSSSDVPLDIKPISIESSSDRLEITWDKELQPIIHNPANKSHQPHKSIYPISFLHSYSTKQNISKLRYNHLKPIIWDPSYLNSSPNLWVSYNDYMNSNKILLDSLKQIWDYGIIFIRNVPTSDDDDKGILNIVERIGTVRSTFYGKVFDVKSVPAANNIAYTSLGLNLHMDLL